MIGRHTIFTTQLASTLDQFMIWQTLRGATTHTTYWPILLPDPATLPRFHDIATRLNPRVLDTPRLIQHVKTVNIDAWLSARRLMHAASDTDFQAALTRPPQHAAPRTTSYDYSPLTYNYRTQGGGQWSLAFIPTPHSWQVPLYVQFAGINTDLEPMYHAAVLRRWQQQHGAEIVALTEDSLELIVTHPLHNAGTAWNVALDQIAYCPDLLQLTDVETLAEVLQTSTAWFFWWD